MSPIQQAVPQVSKLGHPSARRVPVGLYTTSHPGCKAAAVTPQSPSMTARRRGSAAATGTLSSSPLSLSRPCAADATSSPPPGNAGGDASTTKKRERHTICMVCDFFYPHMGVCTSLLCVVSGCQDKAMYLIPHFGMSFHSPHTCKGRGDAHLVPGAVPAEAGPQGGGGDTCLRRSQVGLIMFGCGLC